jgi:hypothetical protein
MKKTGASMMFLTLMIVVLTTFVIAAGTQVSQGANVPVKTGVSSPGQFRQGMQTGTFGQGQAGGMAGGVQSVPGGIGPGQPQGPGIVVGEQNPSGGSQCYCIRAPCNCPGSSQSGQLPIPGQFQQNQPMLNQPVQGQQVLNQPFQGQPLNTLPASTGAGNAAFGNAASARAGTL